MKDAGKTNTTAELLRDMVDEHRIVYNWQQLESKRRKQRINAVRYRIAGAAAALCLLALGIAVLYPDAPEATLPEPLTLQLSGTSRVISVPTTATHGQQIPLSDGSTMTLSPGASLEVADNAPRRFRTVLHSGWARYNVIPNRGRIWEVDAGLCRVVVLGTQFTVNRTPDNVHVAVHRGQVAVYPPGSDEPLTAITAGHRFSLHPMEPDALEPLSPAPGGAKTDPQPGLSEDRGRPDDRKAERTGRLGAEEKQRGGAALKRTGGLSGLGASDEVNALLEKADAAIVQNRPRQAAALFAQILREYPTDPAVGIVALTLGNLHLDTLGQPGQAAKAYRIATRSKRLPAALREQAYARCVEASHRSGDAAAARAAGEQYRRRYPNGAWRSLIDRWVETE